MLRAADAILKTDTGRQRRDNEDNAYMRAPLFVVADGMGGAQAGEVASALAVEEFQRELPDDGPPEQRLADRVQSANRRIYETSQTTHERAGMGTTLTAVYVDDADLAVAHVGDSRAYIFRDGKLQRLTQDHSLVEELVRRGKLTEEQAAEHPQRSIITRALGIETDVEVDTWTYPLKVGDVVLLCSDGLTSMISEDQITRVFASETKLQKAADRLIDEANAAGGRDNITVVLFRLEEVGSDGRDDQPTQVGIAVPVTDDAAGDDAAADHGGDGHRDPGSPAPAAAARSSPSGTATLTAPDRVPPPGAGSGTRPRPTPPLARTQGRPAGQGPTSRRRSSRLIKPMAALLSTIIVLFLFGGGAYLATRELFFIGTNSDGIVTLYRGLPYAGPFGLKLYEKVYVSGVPVSAVPAARRKRLLSHDLRSQNDAIALIHAAELGQLAR